VINLRKQMKDKNLPPVSKKMMGGGEIKIENDRVTKDNKVEVVEEVEVLNDKYINDFLPKLTTGQLMGLIGGVLILIGVLLGFARMQQPFPDPEGIHPLVASGDSIYRHPKGKKFTLSRGEFEWDIQPVFEGEFAGLVLSAKRPNLWTVVAEPGRSQIIENDVTYTWGGNAKEGRYLKGRFGNTSTAGYADGVGGDWDKQEYGYMALVGSDPEVGRMIRLIKAGDQYVFKGTGVIYREKSRGKDWIGRDHRVFYVKEIHLLERHQHTLKLMMATCLLTGVVLCGLALFNTIFPPEEDQ